MYGQPAGSSESLQNGSRTSTRRAKALAQAETRGADTLTWLGYFTLLASIILTALAMHGFPTR
jgi:hypothetical protein